MIRARMVAQACSRWYGVDQRCRLGADGPADVMGVIPLRRRRDSYSWLHPRVTVAQLPRDLRPPEKRPELRPANADGLQDFEITTDVKVESFDDFLVSWGRIGEERRVQPADRPARCRGGKRRAAFWSVLRCFLLGRRSAVFRTP